MPFHGPWSGCNPCTFQDFANTARKIVGPALLGAGLPWQPVYNTNFATELWPFILNIWTPYNNWGGAQPGCVVFQNRIDHWNQQLASNPWYNQYTINRKLAKIAFAQAMWTCCGCIGPVPAKLANPERDMLHEKYHELYSKVISSLDLDLSDLMASGETRDFTVKGTDGAGFILEIKDNTTGYYYNFTTNTFTATKANLDKSIENGAYNGSIIFPSTITTDTVNGAVTSGVKVVMDTAVASKMAVGDRVTGNAALDAAVVTVAALNPDGDNVNEFSLSTAIALADDLTLSFSGDDQYDSYLHAKPGTRHADYIEARFGDDTVDINSSTGSNSLTIQKVIYQYAEVLLTMSMYSVGGTITPSASTNDTIAVSRNRSNAKIPFTISATSASTESFTITKQPTPDDVISFLQPVVLSAPEDLPGENIYPTVNNTDTVDGAITGGGSVVKVVMDTNVADKMVVGDKITAAVATDTVDGAVTSGIKVVMDNNVVGKMAIGDQITGNTYLNANVVTVAALNPDGDNAKEFSMSEAVAISDGVTLTFTPKCNRSLTTVVALNPDTDNVKEFSMSQNVGLIDGVTLSFSNQMNYQWPLDNIHGIEEGMIVLAGTNVTTDTSIAKYEDIVTIFEDTEDEEV